MIKTFRSAAFFLVLSLALSTCGGGGEGGEATTGAPIASVSTAASVTQGGAILQGSVTPNGVATEAWFEYGTDASLSTYTSTAAKSVGSGTTAVPTEQPVSGCAAGTVFYFRVCGSNAQGTTRSTIASFTTSPLTCIKTFGGPDYEYGYSVRQTADGGYIVAGDTFSFGAGALDVYLIKTDANGNLAMVQ